MNSDYFPWLVLGGVFAAFLIFKRAGQISSERARQLVKDGATLVDVRSKTNGVGAQCNDGNVPEPH